MATTTTTTTPPNPAGLKPQKSTKKKSGGTTLKNLKNQLGGGGTSTGKTTVLEKIYPPNAIAMRDMGIPESVIKKYTYPDGQPKPIALNVTGSQATGAELLQALDGLPPSLQKAMGDKLLLNDPALGKTSVGERADKIMSELIAVQGHVGNFNQDAISLQLALQAGASTQKEVVSLAGELASGNAAALAGATASARYSAEANADNDLTNWGIDTPELNKMVAHMVAQGVTNVNEILQNVRETETYKQAFPGLSEYNAQKGHVHMTEAEYRTYSQAVLGAAQQFGGVSLNQHQIGALLKGNVSASEFSQRVQDIGAAVNNADPNVKAILEKQFGLNPQHLFAWWANPKEALPDLQRAVASADFQDFAHRVGLGGLTPVGAGQLAQMAKLASTQGNQGLGYGISQVEGAIQGAAKDAPLLHANPGAAAPTIDTTTLLGSVLPGFGGTDQVQAGREVELAEQAKAAPFEKGGGYAENAHGIEVGTART